MKYNLLDIAYASLMHDIGKFYQRTKLKSDLTDAELKLTPISKKANYHTHLHSGYTSRFFKEYLQMDSEYEMLTSAHHLSEMSDFADIIKRADRIASAIDRNDELFDYQEKNKNGVFQQVRLSSIFSEIDFGKKHGSGIFELNRLSNMTFPNQNLDVKSKEESVDEYKQLFKDFVFELKKDTYITGNIDRYLFDRTFALLYEYTTTIPASTYEGNKTYVSLFDHLKLTSAIASCIYLSDIQSDHFCMLEFDVSGIQNFIFKVTEGKDTKRDIAKSLRGRSFFVSLVTDIIIYGYLNEFNLTQSNIIFNTGGGALLLLPYSSNFEERIKKISNKIGLDLYKLFGTDLTFVYSYVVCNANELETFKIEKAVELKKLLEEEKTHKFSYFMDEGFYVQHADNNHICKMCGTNFADEKEICVICNTIKKLSEYFVKHTQMFLVFDYHQRLNDVDLFDSVKVEIGSGKVYLIDINSYNLVIGKYDYIESINNSKLGNTRFIANLVPQKNNNILSFEDISTNLILENYGDDKLAILKMDVDNLGAMFAFGLPNTRSLSKFLTLSRLIEIFFSNYLMEICKDVSKKFNPEIKIKSDSGSVFYINYAGGDDLVIIGPVTAILMLANEIHKKFKEYTLNQNITISGGIFIQTPKAPIRFGVKGAELNLSMSKSIEDKNSMTLLNTTFKLDDFEMILNKTSYFKKIINENVLSRSVFYGLMKEIDTYNFEDYLKVVPKLYYSLKRNVMLDKNRVELVREFSQIDNMKELRILILEMKLAIMQTRG